MKTYCIGIDISKASLDIAFLDSESTEIIESYQINNEFKSIMKLINKIKKTKIKTWVCFEHTGNYGLLLSCLLQNNNIVFSAVPALEIKQSTGMTRGKNDKVDAQRIAQYAFRFADKLEPSSIPSDTLLKIKNLLTYRRALVKDKTSLKNQTKAFKVSHQVVNLQPIISDLQKRLNDIKISIKKVEHQIAEIINDDDDLKNNYEKITTIKGIGKMIAAHVIMYTNNFTAFDNPRKFNSYCGLAPFQNSSGTKVKKSKTSKLRNKTLKALFFNGANSAALFDDQLKKYYLKKKLEGKHHNSIINAISCKLVYRIFAVIKRNENYVQLNF